MTDKELIVGLLKLVPYRCRNCGGIATRTAYYQIGILRCNFCDDCYDGVRPVLSYEDLPLADIIRLAVKRSHED